MAFDQCFLLLRAHPLSADCLLGIFTQYPTWGNQLGELVKQQGRGGRGKTVKDKKEGITLERGMIHRG